MFNKCTLRTILFYMNFFFYYIHNFLFCFSGNSFAVWNTNDIIGRLQNLRIFFLYYIFSFKEGMLYKNEEYYGYICDLVSSTIKYCKWRQYFFSISQNNILLIRKFTLVYHFIKGIRKYNERQTQRKGIANENEKEKLRKLSTILLSHSSLLIWQVTFVYIVPHVFESFPNSRWKRTYKRENLCSKLQNHCRGSSLPNLPPLHHKTNLISVFKMYQLFLLRRKCGDWKGVRGGMNRLERNVDRMRKVFDSLGASCANLCVSDGGFYSFIRSRKTGSDLPWLEFIIFLHLFYHVRYLPWLFFILFYFISVICYLWANWPRSPISSTFFYPLR